MKRNGFTLIELLVVIAIIAILAAILFPVFAQVREKARQTACLSNEKQIGLAVMQYVQDNDEQFPYTWGVAGAAWRVTINPYIKTSDQSSNDQTGASETGVWRCPSDTSGQSVQWLGGTNYQSVLMPSYAANSMVFGGGLGVGAPWQTPAKSIAAINAPADCVMAFEYAPSTDWSIGDSANPNVAGGGEIPSSFGAGGDTGDGTLAYYKQLLATDITGKVMSTSTGASVCGPITLAEITECKEVSWRHSHSNTGSGMSNMIFSDGHAKAIRFGTQLPHEWVPEQLSDTQLAAGY